MLPFVVTALLLAADGQPTTTPTPETVLKTLTPDHPRLILSEDRLKGLKTAIAAGEDPALTRCYENLLARADRHLKDKPLVYHKVGPRLLSVSRDCLGRTYALGLAWRLTGKSAYADAAVKNLLAVCAFDDWNPSHFLDTAEMSHAVGLGYDWLYPRLDEPTRTTIRQGLIRNGLKPGVVAYTGPRTAWWVRSEYNWNQVCNGGLMIGALAIAETDPDYARTIIPAAVASLPKALASYAPDGAWGEGVGYWHYATRYTAYGLAALDTALGTDFGLAKAPGLSKAAWFPIHLTGPTGLYLNFADVGERSRRRPAAELFWLAYRFCEPKIASAEHQALGDRWASPEHLVWYVPRGDVAWPGDAPLDRRFGGPVEVAVFRSAWGDPDALWVGVKAGYNAVNHGHLDLGNFELDALGVRWARDLGSDNYNLPGYWAGREGGQRWSYYRLNSHSHNVPLLDGEDQKVAAKASFTRYASRPDAASVVIDLTTAYAPKASRVHRGVMLTPGRRAVLVQDEFDLPAPARITWGLTTDAEIALDGPRATLSQSDKQLRVSILSPAGATFSTASAAQQPPQKPNKGVRRLLIDLPAQSGLTRLAVLFAPARPGAPAPPPQLVPLSDWPDR